MNRLSFCIITLNEENNLLRALQSVQRVADDVVVVDSGSTDRTREIARELGARIFERAWTNFGDQKNFAASQASFEWCFTLDADEALSDELRESLLAWKKNEAAFEVYEVARRTWYLDGWVRHSGWYPNFQRRLYRRNAAKYKGIVHESLDFGGKAGRVNGDLLHYTVENFAEHEEKVERYATLAGQKMFEEGKRSWRAAMWVATPWTFFRSFVIQAGFLDGHRGALIAQMAARGVRLKFQRLGALVREEQKSGSR